MEHGPTVPKEWGSGKFKEDVNVYIPGPPTWQYSGEPVKQHYGLTQLKLSNIRSNDQLLLKPQESQMGRILINRDFPAEHPYSSHMERMAVFPKFDASEDPKRGVAARYQQPLNSEMPSTAFDVQIINKTKGSGLRHELQALPTESEKIGLEWKGEKGFHQLVKTHGGRQQFYPIPPKTVVPNLQSRAPDMSLSDNTANSLRNVERDQWQTTYDLQHTGIGPSNPMSLENLNNKMNVYYTYGVDDDNLYPRSKNTFDPPRPFEGRISRKLIPKPPPQKPGSSCGENTSYKRMMTLREKEEERLWNGTEYVSLPDPSKPKQKGIRWKELNDFSHPEPNLEKVEDAQEEQPAEDIPYHPTVGKPPSTEEHYLQTTKDRQSEEFQEMEARNRFQVLEAHKPSHDLSSLEYKMSKATTTEKPKTFYNHEGQYNEERAGLYRTNYLPERLTHSMNPNESSAEIMDTFHSYRGIDDLNLPTRLNQETNDALRYSRTLASGQANLAGDRRDAREVLRPIQDLKQSQKQKLQPTDISSRYRVQEGEIINKECEMGENYNTQKFLQDYELPRFARNEPLNVMSTSNQKLSNVRGISGLKSGKSVSFSDSVTVASTSENGPIRVFGTSSNGLTPEEQKLCASAGEANTTQYTSTHAMYNKENTGISQKPPKFTILSIQPPVEKTVVESKQAPVVTQRKPRRATTALEDTEYRDEFGSLSSNVAPTNLRHSFSLKSAYESQFPVYNHIGYKDDMRFSWEPGCGHPRPQSTLLDIQNSFTKSGTRKMFHGRFSESNPDLRENIVKGKKHSFFGMSGQIIHG